MLRSRLWRPGVAAALVFTGVVGALSGTAHLASAASTLRLNRYNAAPGDSITAQGFGFTGGDDIVATADVTVSGKFQRLTTSTVSDGSGNFAATLTVPNNTNQGTYTLVARDFHGHDASQKFNVLPLAYLQANGKQYTTYVIPTHGFFVRGAGYQPGETVRLTTSFPLYDGNTVSVDKSFAAAQDGTLPEVFINVPLNAKVATVLLRATGESSKRVGSANLKVLYRPTLTLGSDTVRPGTSVDVHGHEFVPNSTVHVAVTIPRTGDTTVTLSRDITSDDHGNFEVGIGLPSNVRLGHYAISATDTIGNASAHTAVTVSVKPSITLVPGTVYPGQSVVVSGDNFGSGARVVVSGDFTLQGGAHRTVAVATTTGGRGNYSVHLQVPSNAAVGKVVVTAHTSNSSVQTSVQIRQRPALPTATPKPTATGTPVPAATVTATALPTATLTPAKTKKSFGYRYVSIWYHVVRAGTYDVLVVQAKLHTTQGLWVHVLFPSGQGNEAYFVNTDSNGFWQQQIPVPASGYSPTNNKVFLTFRLWHGGQSRRFYGGFTLVR